MSLSSPTWWLLVTSLPSRSATPRMRVWRALKGLGAAVLRDGVYVLPATHTAQRALLEQAQEVTAAGGSATVLPLNGLEAAQASSFRALFDRSSDYTRLIEALTRLRAQLTARRITSVRSQLRQLRRDYDTIRAIDYFAGPAAEHVAQLLDETETTLNALASPGEPHARDGVIRRLDPKEYRGRTWATRARPWVDRLASAWLIRRFIDPKAKILWLKDPKRCPTHALGFDFDEATFTHVGARVTFEVLLASFGLEADAALTRLGALVHYLDIGGAPVAEAQGLAAVLSGARLRLTKDDVLLAEASKIFDNLYTAYSEK